MKKSEIKALKDAFRIPEPERKDSFIPYFKKLLKKNDRSLRIPVIIRYVSTAALAAVIIGCWCNINHTSFLRNNFNNDSITIETESTDPNKDAIVTTTNPSDRAAEPSDKPVSTTNECTETSSANMDSNTLPDHDFPQSAAPPQAVTTAQNNTNITTSKTTVTTAGRSAETTIPVISTTALITDEPVVITTKEEESESIVTVTAGKDYTVSPTVIYTKTDKIINIQDINNDAISPSDNNNECTNSLQYVEMVCNSDYIVWAEIDDIIYTEIDGKLYTQENLTIRSVCSGDGTLREADKISIYLPGGYMPIADYIKINDGNITLTDDFTVYDSGGNLGEQNVGDSYLFFLKKSNGSVPDGAFVLLGKTDISVFEYSEGAFVSIANNNLSFTYNELIQTILRN